MIYGNEETVGQGIKEGLESTGLSRKDLFITSKLWLTDFDVKCGRCLSTICCKIRTGLFRFIYLMHWLRGTNEAVMIDT